MNNRRDFLKNTALTTAALALPGIGSANINDHKKIDNENFVETKINNDFLKHLLELRSEVQELVDKKSLARKILKEDRLFGATPRYEKNPMALCHYIEKRGVIPGCLMEGDEIIVPTFEIGQIITSNQSSESIADFFIRQENDKLINGLLTAHISRLTVKYAIFCLKDYGFTPKYLLIKSTNKNFGFSRECTIDGDVLTILVHPDIPEEVSYICADPNEYAVMPIIQDITIVPLDHHNHVAIAYEEVGFATLDYNAIVKVVL